MTEAASSTAPSAASSRSPGAEAKEFLQGQVTNDVEGLSRATGCYAAFLTHKGKMLGDLRVLDAGDELLLDCERVALQELFNMIRRFKLGREVELHKRTLERGLLSLVGPDARRIAGAGDLPADEHAHRAGAVGGAPVRLIATDVGVDVLCDAADTERVAAALVAAGAVPATRRPPRSCASRRGRPRYGVDLDDSVIPQEAGLNERAVSFEKGCYVGQETVARLHFRGKPNRHLRGLRLSGPAAPGDVLRLGEREVGAARHGRRVARCTARSRWRSCAARRRPATRSRSATGASAPRSSNSRSRKRKLRRGPKEEGPWPRTCSSSPPSQPPRTTCWPPCASGRAELGAGRLHARDAGVRARRSAAMEPRLEEALARWREAGLKAEGVIGDADPVQAVAELCSRAVRRGDRLHAPGPDVALAALGRPVPDRRAHRPAGHARRRGGHAQAGAPRRAAGAARAGAAGDAQRDVVPRVAPARVVRPR